MGILNEYKELVAEAAILKLKIESVEEDFEQFSELQKDEDLAEHEDKIRLLKLVIRIKAKDLKRELKKVTSKIEYLEGEHISVR